MGRKKALLGKLAPPDTSGLLPRERLFLRLDEARKGSLAWVTAPAGSGKTSLLASWTRARGLPVLWYQIDEGDNDLATFFHYLNLAAGARRRLPRLSPEHLMAPEVFARRYFTHLFQGWTTPQVLVLDNYQKLGDAAPLHRLLDLVLDLLPRDSLMAVASRRDAPDPLSGRYAYAATLRIGSDDLRFTESESGILARLWDVPGETAAGLHAACDGWAAIQVLLMRLGANAVPTLNPAHAEPVTEFLDREFLAKLPATERAFLLQAALPPFVSGMLARDLTGVEQAAAILARFGREHLLISQYGQEQGAGSGNYQFHPILRDFLLLRLERDYPADELKAMKIKAARLLEAQREVESAADLLIQAGAWDELGRLICAHAAAWMGSSRVGPLRQWLEALPETVRTADPWLLLWHGSVLRLFNPPAARQPLAQAYQQFMAQENAAGAYLAWAAVVESFSAPWHTFAEIGSWLVELERLQQRHPQFPSPEIEARVLSAGMTLLTAAPFTPQLQPWIARAEALLLDPPSLQSVGLFAWMVVMNTVWRGDGIEQTRTLLSRVSFPAAQAESFPLSYMLYASAWAQIEGAALNLPGARDWVASGLAVAAQTGIHLMDSMVQASACFSATIVGDPAQAEASMVKMEQLLDPTWTLHVMQVQYLRAGILLMSGDFAAAVKSLEGFQERVVATGAVTPMAIAELLQAQALALNGQAEAARDHLSRPREFAQRFPSPMTEFQADLVEAYSWFSQDEEEKGLAALHRALAVGRRLNAMGIYPFWLPQMLTPLCVRALKAGIEVDYVRRLIRKRGLPPESAATENWPWPIRVYTLGRFAAHKDDVPISVSGKTQKKPLQLLKALIALGGRSVAASTLSDALWQVSAEGTARHALDMAVSRLRKLLGDDRAILVQEGKLSLNDKLVWVDAWAFQRLAGNFEKHPGDAGLNLAQQAVERYTGAFLAGDEEEAWLLGRRDRLRSHYLRLVSAYGSALERLGQWNQAIDGYRRALELDPLAEAIYQGLMRCHLELDEPAQALETYRRCRQMLSVVWSVSPSPQTEKLAERARCR
jgi:LuxR family maltose regulon positive regulatory protein